MRVFRLLKKGGKRVFRRFRTGKTCLKMRMHYPESSKSKWLILKASCSCIHSHAKLIKYHGKRNINCSPCRLRVVYTKTYRIFKEPSQGSRWEAYPIATIHHLKVEEKDRQEEKNRECFCQKERSRRTVQPYSWSVGDSRRCPPVNQYK